MAPVLAAEKSHVPFYIAGGVLVVWALIVSMAIGMRNVSFPATDGQQRAVMGITVVLVAITLVAAVATSSSPTKEAAATAATPTTSAPAETTPAPAETTPAPAETTPKSTQPTATTGTPAPPSSPAGKAQKIALEADPGGQLAYSATTLKAKAGTVTIEFMNTSPVEHNVTVEQGNKNVLGATPTFVGGKRSLTLKLQPGTYTFFCSVPGHRQAGMEGKLVVSS
jgi:plastocyanin